MFETPPPAVRDDPGLRAEIARLKKIVQVLMNRAEQSTNVQGSDFSLFQTAVMLEEQVRGRTVELEAALRENEKVNRALRESEAKFFGVVNQSLVGIGIIEEGKFTQTNPKLHAMFGYSADEGRALGLFDIAIESDRPIIAESIRKRLSGEEEWGHHMFRGRRKNGEVIDIVSCPPVEVSHR